MFNIEEDHINILTTCDDDDYWHGFALCVEAECDVLYWLLLFRIFQFVCGLNWMIKTQTMSPHGANVHVPNQISRKLSSQIPFRRPRKRSCSATRTRARLSWNSWNFSGRRSSCTTSRGEEHTGTHRNTPEHQRHAFRPCRVLVTHIYINIYIYI